MFSFHLKTLGGEEAQQRGDMNKDLHMHIKIYMVSPLLPSCVIEIDRLQGIRLRVGLMRSTQLQSITQSKF